MRDQFTAMLDMQDRMNIKVHPEWIKQNFAWHRALWIECGELIDHYGYKWWKKQTPEMEQVKLEIVDIWHFGMSMLFDGRSVEQIAASLVSDLNAGNVPKRGVLEATEELATSVLATRKFSIVDFMSMLDSADMNLDDLYVAYVGKNVLNFFRQDNGYKEGTYIKNWAGREDNEHLVELAAELEKSAGDFSEQLYKALDSRYKQLQS
jgi:dimeric dUTPase (all-alpha-NTP-PPase superfamily)|tara:strand:- start:1090 stop:1710 length:621 start_codon:yes stop_codon:yes gene_type:complete